MTRRRDPIPSGGASDGFHPKGDADPIPDPDVKGIGSSGSGRLRLALTVTEAAHALGVSDDFFREHIAPELRWVRRGRRKLVSVRELEAWLDRSAALTLE
jgi:excisionase family DNA binding protein